MTELHTRRCNTLKKEKRGGSGKLFFSGTGSVVAEREGGGKGEGEAEIQKWGENAWTGFTSRFWFSI